MSDDEEFFSGEEEVEGVAPTPVPVVRTPEPAERKEESLAAKVVKMQELKNPELDENLKLYLEEWKNQTAQEEDELKKLKERVMKRKAERAEEEKRLTQMRHEEEELRIQEAEEKKQRDVEEKLRRLQENEKKRQLMMEEQKKGRNFTIASKAGGPTEASETDMRIEKSPAELAEMKKIALAIRVKPLDIGGLQKERLKKKAGELWEKIVALETERYDLEERQKRQEYDMKELKERQKQQLRQRAMKLGLEPEALTGKYPPKILVASKYERRVDIRSFGENKSLFEGGFDRIQKETREKSWMEKQDIFTKRDTDECPHWLVDLREARRLKEEPILVPPPQEIKEPPPPEKDEDTLAEDVEGEAEAEAEAEEGEEAEEAEEEADAEAEEGAEEADAEAEEEAEAEEAEEAEAEEVEEAEAEAEAEEVAEEEETEEVETEVAEEAEAESEVAEEEEKEEEQEAEEEAEVEVGDAEDEAEEEED